MVWPSFMTSFSVTRASLTIVCMTEMYKMRGYPSSRLDNVGRCSRYCLSSSKVFCCSSPQSTFAEPLSIVKNGKLCFASFVMNRIRDAMQPVSFWMSFLLY
jgi:hypothetical protein